MKKILFSAIVLCSSICATAQTGAADIKTAADSLSYAAGMMGANGLDNYLEQQFGITRAELPAFVDALKAYVKNKDDRQTMIKAAAATIGLQIGKGMMQSMHRQFGEGVIDEAKAYEGFFANVSGDTVVMTHDKAKARVDAKIEEIKKAKEAEKAANEKKQKEAAEKFFKDNAKKKGVKTLPSGLQYKVIKEGTGAVPTKDQMVTVKYEGRLLDGTVFDSSYKRTPDTNDFKPTQVIKGWTEALTMMPVGSEWELYIPQDLAYGSRETGIIPAFSALIFKVELVGVKDAPAPKATPKATPKAKPVTPEQRAEVEKAVADAKAKIAAKDAQNKVAVEKEAKAKIAAKEAQTK